MKHEYSYGAVVYKKINNEIFFLIEHMKLGHISLPKGHIEVGETEEECALREIKEETNLDVTLDTSFRYKITYSPSEGIIKDVIFFLATPISESIVPQEIEVSSLEWLDYKKAYEILTFDTDKNTLSAAYEEIQSKQ